MKFNHLAYLLGAPLAMAAACGNDDDGPPPEPPVPPALSIVRLSPAGGPAYTVGVDQCLEPGSDARQTVVLELSEDLNGWLLRPPAACGGVAECGHIWVRLGPPGAQDTERCLLLSSSTRTDLALAGEYDFVLRTTGDGVAEAAGAGGVGANGGSAGLAGTGASSGPSERCRLDLSEPLEIEVELRNDDGLRFFIDEVAVDTGDAISIEQIGDCGFGTGGAAGGGAGFAGTSGGAGGAGFAGTSGVAGGAGFAGGVAGGAGAAGGGGAGAMAGAGGFGGVAGSAGFAGSAGEGGLAGAAGIAGVAGN